MSDPIRAACRRDYFPAYHHSGSRAPHELYWLVVHDEEAPTAEAAARYFKLRQSGGSAHLCVDETVCYRCLANEEVPWGASSAAALSANLHGFHIELAGYARWAPGQWVLHAKTVERAAFKTAQHLRLFELPCRWRTASELVASGRPPSPYDAPPPGPPGGGSSRRPSQPSRRPAPSPANPRRAKGGEPMTPTKELDKRADAAKAYAAILDGEAPPMVADPEVVSRAILERIMRAESFDEAFRPQTLTAWKDLEGVPVVVSDFKLNPSGLEGQSVYAVADVTRVDTGEMLTVTCGGRNVMMQLVKALEMGWLDKPVAIVSKQTSEGYSVLWLEAADNPLDDV